MVKLIGQEKARTIFFMRSIGEVDQVFKYVSGDLSRAIKGLSKSTVREYKREIPVDEKARITSDLKTGVTLGVVATSALQLGIDVGDLSVCGICRFPGSRAAFFQQAGRVGRQGESLVLFLADKTPLDQHFVRRPEDLLDTAAEVVYLNPFHHDTVLAHLRVAAEERKLDPAADAEFWPDIKANIAELANMNGMKDDGREVLIVGKRGDAASEVNIRSLGFECPIQDEMGKEVAKPDVLRAVRSFHKYARFQIQDQAYEVTHLAINWNKRQAEARARPLDKQDYATASVVKTSCQILDAKAALTFRTGASLSRGSVRLAVSVDGYYKLPTGSGKPQYQVLGPAAPPSRELDTQGIWLTLPDPHFAGIPYPDHVASVKSANESLRIAAALMCSTDPDDMSVYIAQESARTFRMFLMDNNAGGNGLTEEVYKHPLELLESAIRVLAECPHCRANPSSRGCPRCVTTAWGGDDEVCRDGGIKILTSVRDAI